MTTPKILSIGSIMFDVLLSTTECNIIPNARDITMQHLIAFEYGAKIGADLTAMTAGGGAANTAVNFSKLGMKSGVYAMCGNDVLGQQVQQYLHTHRVDTTALQITSKYTTGLSVVVSSGESQEHVLFMYKGANEHLRVQTTALKNISVEWIYLTSLSGEYATKNLQAVTRLVKTGSRQLMWNPGNEQLRAGLDVMRDLLSHTTVLQLNKDEAIELLLHAGKRITDVHVLLRELHAFGPLIVVITDGANGAYAYNGEREYTVPAESVIVKNTTGAGDAFGSTFAVAYIRTSNIEYALRVAAAQSGAVIQANGAQVGLKSWKQLIAQVGAV